MKIEKSHLKRIIQEEYKKRQEEKILRESIRILLIENNGKIDEGIFGDIGAALSNLAGGAGDALKNAGERVGKFFKGDELDMSQIPMDKLQSAKSKADQLAAQMEKEPVTRNSEDSKKEEVTSTMQEILTDFADFLKAASEPLTMAPNKPNDATKAINDFKSVIDKIDKAWTEGKRTKSDKKLSKFDWTTVNPIFQPYKGPKPSEMAAGKDEEADSSAGKAVEKLLDGNATKALKVAFAKAKNKDSVKETLQAIFAELPEASQVYLKQALKELVSEL